jgi:hypothetical protein
VFIVGSSGEKVAGLSGARVVGSVEIVTWRTSVSCVEVFSVLRESPNIVLGSVKSQNKDVRIAGNQLAMIVAINVIWYSKNEMQNTLRPAVIQLFGLKGNT